MGLDSECGEVSFEDFDSGKLGKIIQEDSDIDRMSKMQVQQDAGDGVPVSLLGNSDDNVPLIQVLDDGTPKTHACPYKDCVKVFSRPWRLARHIHVHTGKVCCCSLDVALTSIHLDKKLIIIKFDSNTSFGKLLQMICWFPLSLLLFCSWPRLHPSSSLLCPATLQHEMLPTH
jgi:hypothetical protein